MNIYPSNYSTRGRVARGYLESFLIISILLALSAVTLEAASPWHVDIDASNPSFIEEHSFGEPAFGFTDVIPPHTIMQSFSAAMSEDGCDFKLYGTELSAWWTTEVPSSARYLLKWKFDYEGQIVEGSGRTGFIFGNPTSDNLLSVEVTYRGSLRLVSWKRDVDDKPLGQIVWSKQMTHGGNAPIRIEVDYDIRSDTMVCSVNGGKPVTIKLTEYMPSAPMTIRGVGFFSAVPEAIRLSRMYPRNPKFDIDLSRQYTVTRHKRLSVTGE